MADETVGDVEAKEVGLTAEELAASEERRRPKRGRDSTFGPTTPRGEGDETKSLSGFTPLAKKGRVQTDPATSGLSNEHTVDSDAESAEADQTVEGEPAGTPPPKPSAGSSSAPDTPDQPTTTQAPQTEGKETKHIRQRVEALEWEDGHEPDEAAAPGTTEDTEIEEGSQVQPKAVAAKALVPDQPEREVAGAAAAVPEQATEVESATVEGAKAAGTAEDVKIPDASEEAVLAPEIMAAGPVRTSTPTSQPNKMSEPAAKAGEKEPVPSTSATQAVPKPATSGSGSFGSYTATASPFSSFSTAASPFAKVVAPTPAPPVSDQKPKVKSNISFGAFSANSSTSAATVGSTESSTSTPAPAPAPSTSTTATSPIPASLVAQPPKTTLPPGFSATAASPFGAFASTSGFASSGAAAKPKPSTSGSNGFGAFSGGAASSFATFGSAASTPKDEKSEGGDKAEAPAEPEEAKRVFTEQEVITGEEDEEVVHSVRSKLYAMVDGAWVERGAGLFKLNGVPNSDTHAARLVMRADATHRLLLNAPLFSKFAIDVFQEKYVRFVVIEGLGPISYMLRTANANAASAVVDAIRARVELLSLP